MYQLEQSITKTLEDLQQNCHISGVKTEFGEEAATVEETLRLKMLASRYNLECTVKIGGCEAIKDIYDAKSIGADSIVSPMIESDYAVHKFTESAKAVFSPERIENLKLYINIETINGFQNLDKIIKSDSFDMIDGIIFGRTDFSKSMGIEQDYINGSIIFDYVKQTSLKVQDLNKEFIIGGGISPTALKFFSKIPFLSKIETRKVVFDAKELLADKNAEECINKALMFEILWLENKQNMFGILSQKDKIRINTLKNRCGIVKLCK